MQAKKELFAGKSFLFCFSVDRRLSRFLSQVEARARARPSSSLGVPVFLFRDVAEKIIMPSLALTFRFVRLGLAIRNSRVLILQGLLPIFSAARPSTL